MLLKQKTVLLSHDLVLLVLLSLGLLVVLGLAELAGQLLLHSVLAFGSLMVQNVVSTGIRSQLTGTLSLVYELLIENDVSSL